MLLQSLNKDLFLVPKKNNEKRARLISKKQRLLVLILEHFNVLDKIILEMHTLCVFDFF